MSRPTLTASRGLPRKAVSFLSALLLVAAMIIAPGLFRTDSANAVDTDNWPMPENTEIVDSSIVSSGISSNGPTGPDTLELMLSYRATVSPGLEWIYLRIDPDLAPYIDEMSVKASGQGANILYTRYFEKVGDDTLGNVKNNGDEYGAVDPYAGDGNVWRVHNDRKYGIAPGTNPKTRRTLGGNWGVFTGVPLQNQLMFAPINVTLNTPIEQIREETGRDFFVADARWQNSPEKAGGKVEIDNESISTGATIDLSADPEEDTPGGDIFSWLYSASSHRHEYGYEMPVMTTSKQLGEAPAESSTLRVVHVESVGNVTYATVGSTNGLGYKPYQFNVELQPEVVEALEGPAVVWQTGVQKNTGRAGAGSPPVEIPKSAFTPEGKVTVTTDQSKAGINGYAVVDDVSTYINVVSGGIFQPATVVDLPLDEDKLIPHRDDPNYFKQIRVKTWFTDANDRTLKYSTVNSYFNLHISDSPTITNISVGAGTSGDELTDQQNVVRQTQNFIQGTANPDAEVTVMKVTGLDTDAEKREVLGQATADESGNWSTKLCKPVKEYNDDGELINTVECETKSFEENGITPDSDAKLIVVARDHLQAASKDILVQVIDVPTNEPTTDYTTDAPLAKDATAIAGKLGAQHQNTTATVVTAYQKGADGELTELGSTSPIVGNTAGGQAFSIPVTAAQLESCPDIVLKAVESTHPKNPSAAMPTAKDDAYSPSNEVVVPVCEQVTVTFDLNGGTLAEPIDPVSVVKGETLGEKFPAATPVKDGYTFKGWATTPDATEGNFDASTALNEDTTVYAAWSTQAIDWGNENGDENGDLVTIDTTYDYGQQLTDADYKALIQNGDTLPADATVSVSPEINTSPADAAGRNQTVDVTVTFGDGSTLTAPVNITIRPAADSYDPVAEAIDVEKGEQPSATTVENAVTDANGQAFPEGTTIELKEPVDTATVGETTGTVVVTYPDGSTDEITIPINVVDTSNAATYEPTTDTITVPYGGELPALDTAVNNKAELPEGTTYEDVTDPAIDTTQPGSYTGQLKVNYPDESTETVPVTVIVQTAAESFDPQAAPVDVNLNEQPTAEQLLAATTLDGTTPLPEGSSVAVVGDLDTSAPGEIADVPLLVTYPDGTTDNITTTVNVIDNRTDAEKFPAEPVTQPVD
ncbi:MAG: Rib/alpha-like domain-containing protein, partial [Bowdeniella nasicola]|nr:Rib/alpha-like domain-containing protein [Bowdeniella nasicola]